MALHRQDQMKSVVVNTQAEALFYMQNLNSLSVPGGIKSAESVHPLKMRKKKKKKKKGK